MVDVQDGVEVAAVDRLDPEPVAAVLGLLDAAAEADGVAAVSEEVVLQVRHGGHPGTRRWLATVPGAPVAGFAHLDPVDADGSAGAELVVHPAHRRRGVGGRLLDALERASPGGSLSVWAHGSTPAAAAFAGDRGYVQQRVLWQLRRSLAEPLPPAELPPGVAVRPFAVGQDESAWLGLNARAFAEHPEQGRWRLADLQVREAEPWFEPSGFLLAERESDRTVVGFHWTKVHPAEPAGGGRTRQPIGEIYVLGVDPAAQAGGLGAALTGTGLRYLAGRGLDQAMLYVDDSNRTALRMYERLGFVRWLADIRYGRPRT